MPKSYLHFEDKPKLYNWLSENDRMLYKLDATDEMVVRMVNSKNGPGLLHPVTPGHISGYRKYIRDQIENNGGGFKRLKELYPWVYQRLIRSPMYRQGKVAKVFYRQFDPDRQPPKEQQEAAVQPSNDTTTIPLLLKILRTLIAHHQLLDDEFIHSQPGKEAYETYMELYYKHNDNQCDANFIEELTTT